MPRVDYSIEGKKASGLSFDEKIQVIVSIFTDKNTGKVMIIKNGIPEIVKNLKNELPNIIMRMLENEDGSLMSEIEAVEIIRTALKSVPDYIVNVREKFKFINDNFSALQSYFTDLAYDEVLPALKEQSIVTKITFLEYQKSFKNNINSSDFIVLTIGLLRNIMSNDVSFQHALDEIEKSYFELDYEKCYSHIDVLCNKLKSNGDQNFITISDYIISTKNRSVEVDNDNNSTRRFFENKLSQYILGHAGEGTILNSMDKISKIILEKEVKTSYDIEEAVSSVAEHYGPGLFERHLQLKEGSPKYKTKDRALRQGFFDRERESGGLLGESTYSRNLGALKANDPNFRDEITKQRVRNRIVDVNRFSSKGGQGYMERNNRNRAAFISSISGHTFYTVAVLEAYMEDNKRDPHLAQDINNFLMAFVGTYAKRGYHSVHEVLDVLREPNVRQVFIEYGVDIDISIDPKIFNNAMNDSLAYSKAISLKKSAHIDLTVEVNRRKIKKEIKLLSDKINNFKDEIEKKSHNENIAIQFSEKLYRFLKDQEGKIEGNIAKDELQKLIKNTMIDVLTRFPSIDKIGVKELKMLIDAVQLFNGPNKDVELIKIIAAYNAFEMDRDLYLKFASEDPEFNKSIQTLESQMKYLKVNEPENIIRGEQLFESFKVKIKETKPGTDLTLEISSNEEGGVNKVEINSQVARNLIANFKITSAPTRKELIQQKAVIEPKSDSQGKLIKYGLTQDELDIKLINDARGQLDKLTESICANIKDEYQKIINKKPDVGSVAESQANILLDAANKLKKINTEYHKKGLNSADNIFDKSQKYASVVNALLNQEEGIKFPTKTEKRWARFKKEIAELGNWFRKKLGMSDPSKHKVAVPLSKEEFQESIGKSILPHQKIMLLKARRKEQINQQVQNIETEGHKKPDPNKPEGHRR